GHDVRLDVARHALNEGTQIMKKTIRFVAIAAWLALAACGSAAWGADGDCSTKGGKVDCVQPTAAGEVWTWCDPPQSTLRSATFCNANGRTWDSTLPACIGMAPPSDNTNAQGMFMNFLGAWHNHCNGPTASGSSDVFSNACGTYNGPTIRNGTVILDAIA